MNTKGNSAIERQSREVAEYARKHGRITREEIGRMFFVQSSRIKQIVNATYKMFTGEFIRTRSGLTYIPPA